MAVPTATDVGVLIDNLNTEYERSRQFLQQLEESLQAQPAGGVPALVATATIQQVEEEPAAQTPLERKPSSKLGKLKSWLSVGKLKSNGAGAEPGKSVVTKVITLGMDMAMPPALPALPSPTSSQRFSRRDSLDKQASPQGAAADRLLFRRNSLERAPQGLVERVNSRRRLGSECSEYYVSAEGSSAGYSPSSRPQLSLTGISSSSQSPALVPTPISPYASSHQLDGARAILRRPLQRHASFTLGQRTGSMPPATALATGTPQGLPSSPKTSSQGALSVSAASSLQQPSCFLPSINSRPSSGDAGFLSPRSISDAVAPGSHLAAASGVSLNAATEQVQRRGLPRRTSSRLCLEAGPAPQASCAHASPPSISPISSRQSSALHIFVASAVASGGGGAAGTTSEAAALVPSPPLGSPRAGALTRSMRRRSVLSNDVSLEGIPRVFERSGVVGHEQQQLQQQAEAEAQEADVQVENLQHHHGDGDGGSDLAHDMLATFDAWQQPTAAATAGASDGAFRGTLHLI